MPTNDFKAFAIGGGANVMSQADYLALAALATGFASGIANPPELNKVWRQAAFIAAAMAQVVCDETGLDMLDDGDLTGAIAKLKLAIAAASGVISFNTRTGAVTLTSGDVTTALTFTPANKAGDTFTGKLNTKASATGAAGFSLPDGVAPAAPADGDVWAVSSKQYRHAGGVTYQSARDIDIQNSAFVGRDDGSASANSCNLNGMLSNAPSDYTRVSVRIAHTNTGASTMNMNGGTAYPIKKKSAGSLVDVAAGDLVAGHFYDMQFDATNSVWQLMGGPT